jgi:uncharacterized protein
MDSEIGTPFFEWDARKAASNRRKHGVSFEEAATVFADPQARIRPDAVHSGEEDRELILGMSSAERALVVSFVERGQAIRIISSRLATRGERHAYEEK